MNVTYFAAAALAVTSTLASAQSVVTPKPVNPAAGTVVHSAGAAVGVVPIAHNVAVGVVSPTIPTARPFASGVTAAGASLSKGVSLTGANVHNNGVVVNTTILRNPQAVPNEVTAVKAVAKQASNVPPKPEEVDCDATELASGECQ
jgi:hypothetical protein